MQKHCKNTTYIGPMAQEELNKTMAYLDEKIKKASATWKGVDVDAYMDEVRGREPDDNQ